MEILESCDGGSEKKNQTYLVLVGIQYPSFLVLFRNSLRVETNLRITFVLKNLSFGM